MKWMTSSIGPDETISISFDSQAVDSVVYVAHGEGAHEIILISRLPTHIRKRRLIVCRGGVSDVFVSKVDKFTQPTKGKTT